MSEQNPKTLIHWFLIVPELQLAWKCEFVAAKCEHAWNRSLLARGLSIDCRAHVISLHVRWSIRTPRPTCANQDAWAVITPKRPKKVNSIHTDAWHAWTRAPPRNIVQKAVYRSILIWWDRDMAGVVRRTNRFVSERFRRSPCYSNIASLHPSLGAATRSHQKGRNICQKTLSILMALCQPKSTA